MGLFGDAGVMAGRKLLAAKPVGELEHRVEAHVPVAADARIRGLAIRVAGDERLDHARAELVAADRS